MPVARGPENAASAEVEDTWNATFEGEKVCRPWLTQQFVSKSWDMISSVYQDYPMGVLAGLPCTALRDLQT